jgi:hypothetical protein
VSAGSGTSLAAASRWSLRGHRDALDVLGPGPASRFISGLVSGLDSALMAKAKGRGAVT